MSALAILALRAFIVLVALGALLAQIVVVPTIGAGVVGDAELPELSVPYSVAGIALVACVQVALLGIWALLSMVRRDAIFADRAFRWVDVIIGAGTVATALTLALAVHLYFVVEPILDAPGLIAITLGGTICGGAFVLLMVVMRGLLRRATSFRSELDEVV
jgi:hypothetical protein